MNNISSEDLTIIKSNNLLSNSFKIKYNFSFKYKSIIFLILFILIINGFTLLNFIFHINSFNFVTIKNYFHNNDNTKINKSNIDYTDEFFMLKEVKLQINSKNITNVDTITGGYGHIGNALIMLNNLINICVYIKCKNIISPGGLQNIIKKPIFFKENNITIFPNSFTPKPQIDISLRKSTTFWFCYKNKPHKMHLKIIREEVMNNIPKFKNDENDLFINIRSGDVFINKINHMYSQPPLCFYQKFIKENKFNKIYILSNGHENPVVNKLLQIYPKIKYIHGVIEYDISVIVNAYNFVMPISTFPMTLIYLNNNLKNLYYYELLKFIITDANLTYHIMKPSNNYSKIMERKWRNSKEQLELMITEDCINSRFNSYHLK